ncbi:MAG: elongation factor G [Clostridia bacterium]|nr:elongation factor G [Clostridia bacterium]MBQ7789608.1 elongation factor G [Clostridia bacterium]
MAKFITNNIRNVAIIGHSGSGKTATIESMLFKAKATDRLGRICDGNTVSDYDSEEIKRGISIGLSVVNLEWNGVKINLLDCPGFLGFAGEVASALRVADAALINIDAKSGLEVGAEIAWYNSKEAGLPRAFFINKCDDPDADFDRVFNQLREEFGNALCPVFIPIKEPNGTMMVDLMTMKCFRYLPNGERQEEEMTPSRLEIATKYEEIFMEAVAQTNEEMLEKFFGGERFSKEECALALHEGMITGAIVPVWCGSSENMRGIYSILTAMAESFPRHTAKKVEMDNEGNDLAIEREGECKLFVFKTIADPFVGRVSFFKVMNGELKKDMVLKNTTTGSSEKFAKIYTICGKKQTEVDSLACGDIGVISKLQNTNTNDTLCEKSDTEYKKIEFPEANMTMAIKTDGKDEDKVANAIAKILDEDKTVKYENFAETGELLLKGIGDVHLDTVVCKLKNRYGVNISLETPKIAYRETIKKTVSVEGKHKKQSGGAGQYGHVKITFSHSENDGLTFTQSVVGGEVPKGYYPAVEKGLLEAMNSGVLLGYPMVNLAADLTGGSYHDVDSNEISFKLAAKLAYKELTKASPTLLEPIGTLKVSVPESIVGDIMGDLNKRRGRVMGMEPDVHRPKYTVVEAEVPKAEMVDYVISLRAMSQGRGNFTFHFVRYEEVPAQIAAKVAPCAVEK